MTSRVTIIDDYQSIALSIADWSAVRADFDIDVITEPMADTDEVVTRLSDSDVIVAMRERTPFGADVLNRLPRLRLLVTTGMRNASIDLNEAAARGIVVCGTRGAGNPVPELVFGMMIAIMRGFVPEDRAIREGGWQHTIGPGLSGRTLGIVGLGRLGVPVARLAQAFDMHVIAWSPNLTEDRASSVGARAVSRERLFAESDVVTIHMPLAEGTRGLIDASDLRRMRSNAYLINTSRGPIVDEAALIVALEQRWFAGAALDVYDTEPLTGDHPLRGAPNTLLLPHIGYVTQENYEVFYGDAVEDILAFASGHPVRVIERV